MEAMRRDNYLDEGSLSETFHPMLKNKLSTIDEEIQSPTSEKIVAAESKVLIDESDVAVTVIFPFDVGDMHQDGDGVEIDTVVSTDMVMPKRRSLWSRTKKILRRCLCCCS